MINKKQIIEFIIILFFIAIGAGLRLLPHPPNFVPISAIALFGGVYLSKKKALFLPVLAMMISDVFIGSYNTFLMLSVYGSFLIMVFLGFWLKKHKKWYTIGGGAILSAILFFLITNFAVWVLTPWYPKTLFGLIQCYIAAIPFFKNTLLGNLFYAPLFFASYEIVKLWIEEKYKAKEVKLIST